MPVEIYKRFFREEWLTKKPSIQNVNINGFKTQKIMTPKDIKSNVSLNPWTGKYYPKTRDENIKILDDYLTLCEENNIRPVMFTVPVTEKYMATFNKKLLEEFRVLVGETLSKHPDVRFLDGWQLQGFTYADFYNHGHLNGYGAAKFSTCLNDFIEQLDNGG